ncbi:MAG: glycosyltransferase family 2 protein [Dysgonamonadaceae bacterium]|jgi:hypothetical protein|nr:glycosyltransferase family 2 protein [Dysgonamonadaceae bacterium]
MEKKITCILPFSAQAGTGKTLETLKNDPAVAEVIVLQNESESLQQTGVWKRLVKEIRTDYTLIYTQLLQLELGAYALERMLSVIDHTGSGMVYSDCYKIKNGQRQSHPVIDYQFGSLRDDFDFGSLLLYRTSALKKAVNRMNTDYRYAALYDLRLKVSVDHSFIRMPEFLYTVIESDLRLSGEKLFDYVDPKNRTVQLEMEHACTQHLKSIGGWLAPTFETIYFSEEQFPVEATVVIPVRNRARTIHDAVRSVLMQEADFPYNLIVVDNYSTDETTAILQKIAAEDPRLIHVIPQRQDLGIGGCWNEAVMHPQCGKFVIQLDSDDLYIDEHVVAKIIHTFYEQQCAMVIGSYKMVNFQLEQIPPGIISHNEWTPENGRNNALRINGLGAPRAFYTPVLRDIKLPNTSYGEDYAVGLTISRDYRIGRIYDPIYLCRRWEDNSDAALDIRKLNENNLYKDRIRTIELLARIRKNEIEKSQVTNDTW